MKEVPFVNITYTKWIPFLEKWYIKGKGLDLRARGGYSPIKLSGVLVVPFRGLNLWIGSA